MKKILSMILITVMAMSIFCAIPASAAVTHSTRYFFDDFEDGTCNRSEVAYGVPPTSSAMVYNSGYSGSSYAAKPEKVTQKTENQQVAFGGNEANWYIGAGETLTLNFKFKFTTLGDNKTEGTNSHFYVDMLCKDGKLKSDGTVGDFDYLWKITDKIVNQTSSWQDVAISWTNKTGNSVELTENSDKQNNNYRISLNMYLGKNAEFMIDDVEIKVCNLSDITNHPVVSDVSAKLTSDYTVTYNYAFTSPAGGTDASVIKLRDGNAVIGSYLAGNTITVPSAYRESNNLLLEIIPIDSKNNVAKKSTTVAISGSESYTVLDFSDGQTHDVGTGSGSGYSATFTNEGAGGTKGALDVAVTEDNASPAFDVALRKGYSYDISMWIKAKQAIKNNSKVSVVFTQTVKSTDILDPSMATYEEKLTLDTPLTQDEWVYAHGTIENYNGKATAIVGGISGLYDVLPQGKMSIKIGDGKISNTVSGDTLGYVIDDLTVMPLEYKGESTTENHLIPLGECEAFKTGEGTYNVDYSSKTLYGGVEKVITRIMVPYKNRYVIGHLADDISNEGTIQLQASTLDGAKMLVNAKDLSQYYSSPLEVPVRQPETPNVTVVAEFDQTVWGKDMDKLTATVYYNNLSGESTLNALCATYDENNKLITSDVKPLLLSNGEGQVKLSMSATAESKKARVFFWDENYSPIKSDTTPIERNDDANFIYVSTKGVVGAEGGFKTPVATIEEALEKQKSFISSKDTYIVLMQGNHAQTKELKITNEHTANGKLIITSYDKNDKGVISGGYDLTGKFNKEYKDGIYYAEVDLSAFGLTHAPRDLFVNGTRATKARSKDLTKDVIKSTVTFEKKHKSPDWGNNTEVKVKDYGHLESTDLSLLDYDKKWKNENEYEYDLEFVFSALWTNHRCQVKDMKKSTTEDIVIITMDDEGWRSMCDLTSTMGTCTWDETTYETISSVAYPPRYMENALELLDEEGEWYIDFKEGLDRVYYKPRKDLGESIETIEVILPVVDNYKKCLVNIEGTKESNVNYLTFDNVTFAHTTWTKPSTELGHPDKQDNKLVTSVDPQGAVDIRYASNVTIENCDFTKLGISGLRLVKGVKNCNILGNEFYDIAGGAAILGLTAEEVGGDSERYWFRNPKEGDEVDTVHFENNYIHHVAVEYKGAAAVTIGYPSNSLVAHNEIAFIPYSGIHMGYEWNARKENPLTGVKETKTNLTTDIKNNYFHDLFYSGIYDGGAIYTLGLTGGTLGKPLEISGNYTERIGAGAATYYNDQGSTHYYVHDNVSDLSDSKAEVCYTTGKTKPVSNCMNINMDSTAKDYKHHLIWSENYTNISKDFRSAYVADDTTIKCKDTIVVNDLKADPRTKAIIDKAGIEPEYRNNFRSGLQNMMVIDEITLSVGKSVNNTPFYITGKDTGYKNNALKCYVSSSNKAVATATQDKITAVAKGEAIITYTVLENGIYRTVTTKVTVE